MFYAVNRFDFFIFWYMYTSLLNMSWQHPAEQILIGLNAETALDKFFDKKTLAHAI